MHEMTGPHTGRGTCKTSKYGSTNGRTATNKGTRWQEEAVGSKQFAQGQWWIGAMYSRYIGSWGSLVAHQFVPCVACPAPLRYSRVRFLDFFFSSRRRHTSCLSDWSSDVCSSD